jgi:TPR repeat protein
MGNRHLYFGIAVFMSVFCCASIALSSQFENAVEALSQGNYPRAFRLFKPLAEAGDPAAQNNLGVLYREGKGVPQNYPESLKWFHSSADQGDAWAEYNLGLAYEHGYGVAKNAQEAFKWYMMSATQGDSAAQTALGFMYKDGVGVNKNEAEASKWFKLAADQNNAAARQALALLSHDLNSLAFIMPSFWLFARSSSIKDMTLLFRRYSVIIEKQNLQEIDSGADDKLKIISEPGSLTNSMIFTCHRDRQTIDHLTVHLPETADPTSFKRDKWVSRLEIRILADDRSRKVEGEYIKGDLFIDLDNYRLMSLYDCFLHLG